MTIKPKLSDLSLREKIGQTAVAMQKLLSDEFESTQELKNHLRDNPYGAMWVQIDGKVGLEKANGEIRDASCESGYVEQYPKWIKELNTALTVPMLFGADAEIGGKSVFAELSLTTNAAGLGATQSKELAFETGACVASELCCAGLNWIWGPVADLTSPFMGVSINRTYSDDVELCQKLVTGQIKGIQSEGVAATLKHFPGSGKTEYRDAHVSQGINDQSLEEWENEQGLLYQTAIDAGVYSVMVGHCAFPAVDNSEITGGYMPASVSYNVITKLLKEKMGFGGVVVTDGIGMRSLRLTYDLHKLYVELLKAGVDMVLSPMDLEYIDVVEKAVLSGKLSEERINDACQRVLDMKEKIGLFSESYQTGKPLTEGILKKTNLLNKEVAEKSITLVCDHNNLVPLSKDKIKNVAIIYLGYKESTYKALNYLKEVFEKRGANVKIQRYLDDSNKHDEEHSGRKLANENDLILYLPELPHDSSTIFTGEQYRTIVFSLSYGAEKSAVISIGSPFVYYDYFLSVGTYINAYSSTKEVLEAAVAGFYGEIDFTGVSPFHLKPER